MGEGLHRLPHLQDAPGGQRGIQVGRERGGKAGFPDNFFYIEGEEGKAGVPDNFLIICSRCREGERQGLLNLLENAGLPKHFLIMSGKGGGGGGRVS